MKRTIAAAQVEADLSGVYKPKKNMIELTEMQDIVRTRQQALIDNFYKKKTHHMSLLRQELKNKQLREQEIRQREQLEQSLKQNRDVVKKPENISLFEQKTQRQMTIVPANDSQRLQFQELSLTGVNSVYYDPQHFKNLLMKLLCEGYTSEIKRLLRGAPDDGSYLNCKEYYFTMFNHTIEKNKESKMISPIAVAVNVGDLELLETLFAYLNNINIEFGLESKMKSETILKQNIQNTVKKKSPLQYACSLGLYKIVDKLLNEGANPNGPPINEQLSFIDYFQIPLVICMNKKYQGFDLTVDGLTYRKKFSQKDVNFELCVKLLLKHAANGNILIGENKKRRPRPIFHAIKSQQNILKAFLDNIDDPQTIVNQCNFYQETPLCMIAGEEGKDDEGKAKLLLIAGASSFSSELNPLHIAVRCKNYKIMRLLYKEGDASPNRNLANELNPFQMAVRQNDSKLVKELLNWKDFDIDITFQDEAGKNIFHIIGEKRGIEVFKAIISETNNKYLQTMKECLNISSDPESHPYLTPLYFCFPSIELARLYQRYGSDPKKLSFLHCFFTYRPNMEYISFIIKEFKLDVNETDIDGKTALVHVYEEYNKEQMVFLIRLGATVNLYPAPMPGRKSMLLDACLKGHLDLVEFLLRYGADIQAKCAKGKTVQEYIKADYQGKTPAIKNKIEEAIYKHTLLSPLRKQQY